MPRTFLYLPRLSAQSAHSLNPPLPPLHPCLARISRTFSGQTSTTLYPSWYKTTHCSILPGDLTISIASTLSIPHSGSPATCHHPDPDPSRTSQIPFRRNSCSFAALYPTSTPSRGALFASLHPSCLLDSDKPPPFRCRRIKSAARYQQPIL